MTTLKYCPKCQEWKEATATYFYRDNNSKDGLFIWCRLCSKTYVTDRNRARGIKERPKRDLAMQKAHRAEYDRTYHAAHREQRNEERRQKRLEQKALLPPKPPKPEKQKPPKVEKPKPAPVVLQPELQQALTAFLNVKTMKRHATLEWYERSLRYFSEHLAKNNLPQWSTDGEVWADNVNSFLAAKRKLGLKDQSLDNYYRAICAWLRWLKRRKKIQGDVIEMIERPSVNRPLPKAVQPEAAAILLATLKQAAILGENWRDVRDCALFTLAIDTGARIGEIAGLTLDQIDMAHQAISITHSKTNQARTIVFSDNAAKWLQAWLEARARFCLPSELNSLFIGQAQGGGEVARLRKSGMTQRLKIWQKRAGIDRFNFHRLRHSYAVYTLRAKGDLTDIQRQMGHATIATTAIYLRVDDQGRQSRHNTANPLGYLLSQGGAL